jgi:hypothetical protein
MIADPRPPPTVEYWAISLFSSRTFWVAVITAVIGLSAEPEIVALIPLAWLPKVLIGVGLVNMVLRKLTVRPVVLSVPGSSTPVEVPKIGPPDPPVVSD